MKKVIYKCLMIATIIITVIVYVEACRYQVEAEVSTKIADNVFKEDGSQLTEAKDKLIVTGIVNIDGKYPLNCIYQVGDEKANLFSLSYVENNLTVGSDLTIKKNASDALYLLFRESYPNITLEEMGLNSPEEAYQAVQLAVWEIATRTGEANRYTELSFIDSIREEMGLRNINVGVFRKAKDLVRLVEKFDKSTINGIELIPTLVIDNSNVKQKAINIDDDFMVGPYSYSVEASILTDVEITIMDQNGSKIDGKVVDAKGAEIEDLIEQKTFYVRFPESYKNISFNVRVEMKRLAPTIYQSGNWDYIANTYIKDTCEKTLSIVIDTM